ncbi:aliphatic sulfonate ABC transporter substrate-binding protein [Cohnella abietis]|uniref:Methyl-accepting transducer domain-containing protein n=1 Tax=Cohnella abietis TaxID=2507935 RepID=A0A3T1D5W7_9BACL|nr:aliphatic sulfonate ABC transporter substrate-binding protein [Cohnella abietis]BBI33497.1 hypothetical protein KCTCHS21_28960 [Cohnella abietis]
MSAGTKPFTFFRKSKSESNIPQPKQDDKATELQLLFNTSRSLTDSTDSLTNFVINAIENVENVSQSIHQIVNSATLQSSEAEKSLIDSGDLGDILDESHSRIKQMETLVSDTLQASNAGQKTIQKLTEEADKNASIAIKLNTTMQDLNQKSVDISNALELIFAVSKNIQLLALNASIEAAHAGEHGKGFAVVAKEVRRLAEESAANGKQIDKLLNYIQQQIKGCSEIVKETRISSGIVSQIVSETQENFENINKGLTTVTEYSVSVNELLVKANEGKENLIQNIHRVSSLAQESSASAYELAHLSENQASSVLSVAGASQDLQNVSSDIKATLLKWIDNPSIKKERTQQIRIGFMHNLSHSPALLAIHNQLFEQQFDGKFEIRTFTAGPALVNALINNQIDVGYTGPGPVYEAHTKKHKIQIIAGVSQGGVSLVVKHASKIKNIEQLQGKTIAIPQYGNGQHILLRQLLRRYHLKDIFRGGHIRIIQAKSSDLIHLFNKNLIDAALVPEPWVTALENSQAAEVLVDWRDIYSNGGYPNTVIAVNEDFSKNHPLLIEKFLKSHHDSLLSLQEGQPQTYEIISRELEKLTGQSLSVASIEKAFARILWNPKVDRASLQSFAQLSKQEGFLTEEIDFDSLLIN